MTSIGVPRITLSARRGAAHEAVSVVRVVVVVATVVVDIVEVVSVAEVRRAKPPVLYQHPNGYVAEPNLNRLRKLFVSGPVVFEHGADEADL